MKAFGFMYAVIYDNDSIVHVLCILIVTILVFAGPQFVVHHNKVKIHTSPVYEGAKKGDLVHLMKLTKSELVCGDIMIEFFNKPKMMKKVRYLALVVL